VRFAAALRGRVVGMKLTPEKLTAFCAALAETCNVGRSCAAVGISRQTAYTWREDDPAFAAAWERAMKCGLTLLEDEMHRRAIEGTEEPVFHQGEVCGTLRKYSDTLAIFLAKSHNPEKYRDNSRMELTGADGGPVQISDAERASKIAAIMANAAARKDADEAGVADLV
jgi:hypothetical protein